MNAIAVIFVVAAAAAVTPVDPAGIVHVRAGLVKAHACPIRSDILLTAKHVVEDDEGRYMGGELVWSDMAGNEGRAAAIDGDPARDVAGLKVYVGALKVTFPLAVAAPKVGDRVRILGYEEDHPFRPRMVETEVIGIDAGHVFYRKSPGPGSSGSCVLNDADEVVAINHAMATGFGGGTKWGQGVSVYGVWAPELPEPVKEVVK